MTAGTTCWGCGRPLGEHYGGACTATDTEAVKRLTDENARLRLQLARLHAKHKRFAEETNKLLTAFARGEVS